MTDILADRSFNTNIVLLLIGALILAMVGLTTVSRTNTTAGAMADHEMALVQGAGRLGTSLLVVGLVVAVVGVAAVVTGGAVIVALAAANVTTGAAAAAMAVNVGLYAAGGGAATAAVGATVNHFDGH